jgi:hypothetical protein
MDKLGALARSKQPWRTTVHLTVVALVVLALPGWHPIGENDVQVADDAGSVEKTVDADIDRLAGGNIDVAIISEGATTPPPSTASGLWWRNFEPRTMPRKY